MVGALWPKDSCREGSHRGSASSPEWGTLSFTIPKHIEPALSALKCSSLSVLSSCLRWDRAESMEDVR